MLQHLSYSIIIDKGEGHEDYVHHNFRDVLSGPNRTSNRFIESMKVDWYTGTEFPSREVINNNITEKYNNTVATKERTKIDPKAAKMLTLTTCLSKLYKNKTSVLAIVKGGGGNKTQICTSTKRRDPNNTYVEGLKNIEY